MNTTFHVQDNVSEDRAKLRALYERLLGAKEHHVLEAVRLRLLTPSGSGRPEVP